jgi:hypothetical protein
VRAGGATSGSDDTRAERRSRDPVGVVAPGYGSKTVAVSVVETRCAAEAGVDTAPPAHRDARLGRPGTVEGYTRL